MRAMTSKAEMGCEAWTPPLPLSSGREGRNDSLGAEKDVLDRKVCSIRSASALLDCS